MVATVAKRAAKGVWKKQPLASLAETGGSRSSSRPVKRVVVGTRRREGRTMRGGLGRRGGSGRGAFQLGRLLMVALIAIVLAGLLMELLD